jgi:3-deoxy-D-manno-octulosonic-acid transferase
MTPLIDAAYLLGMTAASPWWGWRMLRAGKHRTDWPGRLGQGTPLRPPAPQGRVLVHAVSVGEVNAARGLVEHLAAQGDVVLSVTTDTGHARAMQLFGQRLPVVRYPFDAGFAVERFLDRVNPTLVALMELEVWPNFLHACGRRGIPVGVVNGRLSARSFARYRLARPVLSGMFRRLAFVAAQTQDYADRFVQMGTPGDRVSVTGTMKWDTAQVADQVQGAQELSREMGIDPDRPLVVAGSTAPGEEAMLHAAVPEGVQLLCAPRKPEWFQAAAAAMPGCVRRTMRVPGTGANRFLLDTIGELRKAYALATVVVVGRSFGNLHGSDMMEPVALGKATLIGPRYGDFADMADALIQAGGLRVTSPYELGRDLAALLHDAAGRQDMARAGRAVIASRQGATARHAAMIRAMMVPGGHSTALPPAHAHA